MKRTLLSLITLLFSCVAYAEDITIYPEYYLFCIREAVENIESPEADPSKENITFYGISDVSHMAVGEQLGAEGETLKIKNFVIWKWPSIPTLSENARVLIRITADQSHGVGLWGALIARLLFFDNFPEEEEQLLLSSYYQSHATLFRSTDPIPGSFVVDITEYIRKLAPSPKGGYLVAYIDCENNTHHEEAIEDDFVQISLEGENAPILIIQRD